MMCRWSKDERLEIHEIFCEEITTQYIGIPKVHKIDFFCERGSSPLQILWVVLSDAHLENNCSNERESSESDRINLWLGFSLSPTG
jgi:hypothetical protein